MLVSYAPGPSVFHPATMSKPLFTRHKTDPDVTAFPSRGASPAGSFYGDGLRAHDLPLRGASPSGSFYSHYSSSSPSVASASSSSASTHDLPFTLPHPLTTPWLTRSPRSTTAHIVVSPSTSEFASSPPESPMDDIPETELRRRQLDKATRILGESVPIDLVFQPRPRPLAKPFPDPPPRRSADSPQPGAHERFLTERPARGGGGKLARRASLSLATFASKLRGGGGGSGTSTPHSRDSSQDSSHASPSTSSDHGHAHPPSPRLHGPASTSPITFSFPRVRAPRVHTPPPPPPPSAGLGLGLVLDISSAHGHEHEYDAYDDDEATPVRAHPLHSYSHSHSEALPRVRVVPMPSPTHTHAHAESEHLRPSTPFDLGAHSRPDTPFLDRPGTPFTSFLPSSNPSFDSSRANKGDMDDNADDAGDAFLSPSRRERGQGWSGEWNQRDMQDVIAKLRTLK